MATNPYFNKVVKNNVTIIDLTSDTVTPAAVLAGVTFHDASGASCVGTGSGGGKTIDHINTASVPCEWTNVVATYEMVSRDWDVASGSGSKITRTYQIPFTNAQTSINPEDYILTSAYPMRFERALGDSPIIYVKAPSGETKNTANITPTTTTGTASGDDDEAWSGGIERYLTQVTVYAPDSVWQQMTVSKNMRKVAVNSDGTYTITLIDGTSVTTNAYSGEIVRGSLGNECLISCECKSVTGTPSAYTLGYVVTYSDNSTETFPAASGDIASGGY